MQQRSHDRPSGGARRLPATALAAVLLLVAGAALFVLAGAPQAALHLAGLVLVLVAIVRLWPARRADAPSGAEALRPRSPRETLLSAVSGPAGEIAAIRFNEYQAMACLDHRRAEAAMEALLARLAGGIGQRGTVARIESGIMGATVSGGKAAIDALRYMLCQPLTIGGQTIHPSVAIGVAPTDTSAETALARAIVACGAPPPVELSSDAADFELEQELAAAVGSGALAIAYQPIFDIAQGRVTGAEALLRWTSPRRGVVSPALFVPVLERSRLILDAGLWALSTACRDAAVWTADGLDLSVAVNVSACQVHDPRLIDAVTHCLARNGLDASRLELELTETAAMADLAGTQALFEAVRASGVRLSIDDFGAGYSNFSYLRGLSFDKLKIDRQFVTGVDASRECQAICRSIVALAQGLGLEVLAEGVEREAEVDALRNLGCRYFQGYYFGRPVTAAEFAAFAADSGRQVRLASPVHRQLAALNERIAS